MSNEPRLFHLMLSTHLSLSSLVISVVEDGSCEFGEVMERGKEGIREGHS
jgi:hypothetical protein